MAPLKIHELGGMLPAWDDRFIPDNQASFCRNTYLYSGAAQGWRMPKLLRALTNPSAKYAYRVPTITQGIAGAYLLFLMPPNQGDTVSLGEVSYTFTSDVVNPYDVLLGGTALQSLQNLFQALVFGSQDTAISGAGTVANPAISTNNPYLGFPFSVTTDTAAPGANIMALVQVTPSGTQKLTDISFMPAGTSPAAKFKAVLYNNVSQIDIGGTDYVNQPSTIIAIGEEVVGCTAGVACTSHLAVPSTLDGGTTYWIGFLMDTAVAFAQASASTNSVSVAVTYTDGPPNPVTGIDVTVNPIVTGGPNYQIWGSMTLIQSTDPENTLGTQEFGADPVPFIAVQAPDFGSSYNNTGVGVNAGNRVVWTADLVAVTDTTNFLVGGLNQTADTSILGASQWLEFVDPDTNVLRTPVVDDSFQRVYFASPSQPPKYNTYNRIAASLSPYLLGIPAPGCAPTVDVSGGGQSQTLGLNTSNSVNTYQVPQAAPESEPNSYLILMPVISSGALSVSDIALQLVSGSGAGLFGLIYADNAGVPGDLLAVGEAPNSGSTVPGPVTSTFATPFGLEANTQYWIGFIIAQGPVIQLADDLGTAGTLYTPGVYASGGFPNPAPTGMTGNVIPDLQMWADCINSAQLESRAYVYTWVSEFGEEGPPSPPTLNDGWDNGVWTIGMFSPTPDEMGVTRNIVQTNLYRTVSAVGGQTTYFLVGTFDVSLGTFADAITDDIVAENLELPSSTWTMPPSGLQGIVAMPNGMFAGFKANEIWFCEPFRPHAWPAQYVLTTEYPIVGLGVSGQTVVACTESNPFAATGVNPGNMSEVKIPFAEPCVSRGSIVSTDAGVYYSSPDGLILVTPYGTASNVTQGWITREKWSQYTPNRNIRAQKLITTYLGFGSTNGDDVGVAQQGFTIELSAIADNESFSIYPQPGNHRIGFNTMTAPFTQNIDNVIVDPWTGVVMLLQDGSLNYYDFTDQAPTIQPYLWRSKKFQVPHKDNFGAMRVWFDIPPGGPQTPPVPATYAKPTWSTSPGLALGATMFGVIRVIADGKYVTERELRCSTELMRIVSGFKATTWQWEIEARVNITNIKIATSVKELAQVS